MKKSFKYLDITFILFSILIVPFIFYSDAIVIYDIPQTLLHYLSLLVYLFFLFLLKRNADEKDTKISVLWIFVNLYIVINILSFIYIKSFNSYFMQINSIVYSYLIFCIISKISLQKYLSYILRSFAILSCILCILGCLQFFFDLDIIPQAVKPAITFGNRNTASQIIAVLFPVVVYLLQNAISRKELKLFFIYALIVLLNIIFIFVSKTRSSLLALVLYLLFLLIANISLIRFHWKKVLIVCVVFFCTFIGVHKFLNNEKNMLSTDSFKVRTNLWLNSTGIIKDNFLIGVGLNQFKIYYPKYINYKVKDTYFSIKSKPNSPHNEFVQVFAELGIIGFSLFVGLLSISVFYLIKLYKSKNDNKQLITHLFGVLIIYFVIFNFSFLLRRHIGITFFFIFLGIVNNLYTSKYNTKINLRINKIASKLILAFGIIYLSFSSVFLIKYIKTDKQLKSMYRLLFRKDKNEVILVGEEIRNSLSFRKDVNLLLSHIYHEQNNLKKAEDLLVDLLETEPYNDEALMLLKHIYLTTNRIEKHNQIQRTLSEIYPNMIFNSNNK